MEIIGFIVLVILLIFIVGLVAITRKIGHGSDEIQTDYVTHRRDAPSHEVW